MALDTLHVIEVLVRYKKDLSNSIIRSFLMFPMIFSLVDRCEGIGLIEVCFFDDFSL